MCPTIHSKKGLEEDLHGCIYSCPMITKASNCMKWKFDESLCFWIWFPLVEWQWLRQEPPLLACRVAAKPMWGHALSWTCPLTDQGMSRIHREETVKCHEFPNDCLQRSSERRISMLFSKCFCMSVESYRICAIKGWTLAATKVEAAGISSCTRISYRGDVGLDQIPGTWSWSCPRALTQRVWSTCDAGPVLPQLIASRRYVCAIWTVIIDIDMCTKQRWTSELVQKRVGGLLLKARRFLPYPIYHFAAPCQVLG